MQRRMMPVQEQQMRVYIVEASSTADFYDQSLDGRSAQNLLNTICVPNEFRMALTPTYLQKAIEEASAGGFDILHLSCHGDKEGTGIFVVNKFLPWPEFARLFRQIEGNAPALVMSSCCGAASGISSAFEDCRIQPPFIFGSTAVLGYSEYCAAWAILYHRLINDGVSKDSAMTAMEHINAVVHDSFIYRRWDEEERKYKKWPRTGYSYEVQEVKNARRSNENVRNKKSTHAA
jgi:hypothetical protein